MSEDTKPPPIFAINMFYLER